jgi:hypothetical protein
MGCRGEDTEVVVVVKGKYVDEVARTPLGLAPNE